MKPVGQSVQEVPRADFRNLRLDLPIERLKTFWLSRLSFRPTPHVHDFIRLARLIDPAREVFECGCGERKTYANGAAVPSQKVLIDAGAIPLSETPFGGSY